MNPIGSPVSVPAAATASLRLAEGSLGIFILLRQAGDLVMERLTGTLIFSAAAQLRTNVNKPLPGGRLGDG